MGSTSLYRHLVAAGLNPVQGSFSVVFLALFMYTTCIVFISTTLREIVYTILFIVHIQCTCTLHISVHRIHDKMAKYTCTHTLLMANFHSWYYTMYMYMYMYIVTLQCVCVLPLWSDLIVCLVAIYMYTCMLSVCIHVCVYMYVCM